MKPRLSDIGTVLVVGCGSIGRRHLRNLKSLGVPTRLAVDPREDRRRQAATEAGAVGFETLEEALDWKPTAVIVATPSALHVPVALKAARQGCHLFVEKPLSHALDRVDELIETCQRNRLVTMVGCNYRFDASLNRIKRLVDDGAVGTVATVRAEFGFFLPQFHPYEDYRDFYASQASLGGGVILDRTHELDYLRWIFGDVVEHMCLYGKRSDLDIDTEDVAEIVVRFKSGVIGSVHLDYLQREYRCTACIVGDRGVIEWSFNPQRLRVYVPDKKVWEILADEPDPDTNAMYVAELKHFLNSVKNGRPTGNDFVEGKKLLELLLLLKQVPHPASFA